MKTRLRRLRERGALREMVRETRLERTNLIMPLFVRPGKNQRTAIPSLPGQFQFSVDQLLRECRELDELRVPAVLLFGTGERKDELGSRAFAKDGLIQQAVVLLKKELPNLLVITDVCLCAYTTHGHCGLLRGRSASGKNRTSASKTGEPEVWVENDATLKALQRVAVSHAQAGADLVAPSDMMDGTTGALREALDDAGYESIGILAYAVKYASSFYGPFREAVASSPAFGDRRSYQMDPANVEEALREAALDLEQGADIIMVKPALAYLDVIRAVKRRHAAPVAAFSVSGEYAMIKAAAARGWLAEKAAWWEMLLGMRRAGADIVITYWAKDAAKLLRERA